MDPAPAPYMIRINGHLGATVLMHTAPQKPPPPHHLQTSGVGWSPQSQLGGYHPGRRPTNKMASTVPTLTGRA